jgi:transposase
MMTKYGNAKLNKNGRYVITSRKEGNNQKLLARLVHEDEIGPIPKGHDVHHIDGNSQNDVKSNLKSMSKSEHAKLHNTGREYSQKTKDRISKTRVEREVAKGEKNPKARLTEQKVRMIKVMLRSDIKTHPQIAKLFGVSTSTIFNIKSGKNWSYLN